MAETRREELEAMKVHKVRSRALELGFPHAKSLNKSKDALIEFVLRKEGEGDDGGGGEVADPPTEDEKAAARKAAGMGKKAPPKKGGRKAPPSKPGKPAAKGTADKRPGKPPKEDPEETAETPDGDMGAVVEMMTTLDQKITDLIKRVDGLATGVGEGMDTINQGLACVSDELVTIKGFVYVSAVVGEAIPEDSAEVDTAVAMVREYFVSDEGEDAEGN